MKNKEEIIELIEDTEQRLFDELVFLFAGIRYNEDTQRRVVDPIDKLLHEEFDKLKNHFA